MVFPEIGGGRRPGEELVPVCRQHQRVVLAQPPTDRDQAHAALFLEALEIAPVARQ